MDIFDEFIKNTLDILKSYEIKPLDDKGACLSLVKGTTYLMDKDTQTVLGGYPKESVNLIVGSSKASFPSGTFILGDEDITKSEHMSFGKIVLLKTTDFPDEKIYDFTQDALMRDTSLRFEGAMLRTSPKHYYTNLKVSKKAVNEGFSFSRMAKTVRTEFLKLPNVTDAAVILITGDSPVYKQLLPIAESIKDVTVTLNHIFDGIDMDCGTCAWSSVCDEVEGLRELHKRKNS